MDLLGEAVRDAEGVAKGLQEVIIIMEEVGHIQDKVHYLEIIKESFPQIMRETNGSETNGNLYNFIVIEMYITYTADVN